MLIFVTGKNRDTVQTKIKSLYGSESNPTFFSADEIGEQKMQELARMTSLFGETATYIIRDIDNNEDLEMYIFTHAGAIQQSEHIFICSTKSVLKKEKDILEKAGVTLHEVVVLAKKEMPSFVLADAFLSRDKKRAWKAVHEELETKSPEEVHGGLWYQVKCLLLIQSGATQVESGLHPFVYQKIKKASESFSNKEIETIAEELVKMPHDAHLGTLDFAAALELFVLRFTK